MCIHTYIYKIYLNSRNSNMFALLLYLFYRLTDNNIKVESLITSPKDTHMTCCRVGPCSLAALHGACAVSRRAVLLLDGGY